MILLIPVLFIVHLLLLSQLQFTAWPEMLSYPYLFTNGFTLYKDFVMPYSPGLILLLSGVFQIFGFNVESLKALTWILILVEDLLLLLILRRLLGQREHGRQVSLILLGVFILLQSFLDGNMLWFDFVTILPLLIAFWFGLRWFDGYKLINIFGIGFFLTLAILIKQTAGVYLVGFGIFYLLLRGIKVKVKVFKELGVFLGGILLLLIPLLIYLLASDSLIDFWNWTLFYPLAEWSKFPGYVDFSISKKQLLVFGLFLFPIFWGVLRFKEWIKDKDFLLGLLFLSAALISIYPRFSFFHLQPAIPFVVILITQSLKFWSKKWKSIYKVVVGGVVIIIVSLLLPGNLKDEVRFYSDSDKKLAQRIEESIDVGETVYLLGLNSSEYVFAHKIPPKNWSDNFGWYLEIPGIQEWVLEGLKENSPKKVFWRVPSVGEWYQLGTYQPKMVVKYITQNYRLTDKIEEGVEIWTLKD